MDYQYKLIVNSRSIYKEFEIPSDLKRVKLGTTSLCEFRLNPDYFFGDIEILFEKHGKWILTCQDDMYVSVGDIRKLLFKELSHGDILNVYYSASGEVAFSIRFLIDFEANMPNYNWRIDLSNIDRLTIGDNSSSDIQLLSSYCTNSSVILSKKGTKFILNEISTPYGITLNGTSFQGEKELKNYDNFSISDFSAFLIDGYLYLDKKNMRTCLKMDSISNDENSLNYPCFNRSTRVKYDVKEDKIPILIPPAKPKKPEQNLLVTLVPSLVTLVLIVVVRGFMSDSKNMSFILFSACTMLMGILTSIYTYFSSKKKYKKEIEERVVQYNNYIEKKEKDIVAKRRDEKDTLVNIYRDTNKDIKVIENFEKDLFDRIPNDKDYLKIYIGTGSVKSMNQVDYKKPESFETDDELLEIPSIVTEKYKYINQAPITLDLKKSNVVGIVGQESQNYNFFKNIVLDLVSRHYFYDVQLFMMLPEEYSKYQWAKYLPHCEGASKLRNFVYDNESKNTIFEFLYKELTYRNTRKENESLPSLIILVMNEHGLKNHPLSHFLSNASKLNVTFVFFENYSEQLPLYCDEYVELDGTDKGYLTDTANGNNRIEFNYDVISDELMYQTCEKLAPVYCEEISLESSLRKSISMFELLHIYSVSDIDLDKRWNNSVVQKTMAAPLGVNSKDEIVYLDLHEKAHGPHGLVAGTTGSGKSEILQTYILSIATLYHPYEVSFVIIDFKGGGMVNQFKNLPHLIGAITNIDGREIDRSLKSIKAELLKRQTLFAKANVNRIDKYIDLYKKGRVSIPLPHLVIIVDEFAELKAEQPEFMKELISASRIGRSLGVHLILATQKPSGQVNEQIWSNSKFKLCLKVQSKEDSNEVIKSPLAAEIKEPGRAYLQVGNNEIFELLQSGYSGAKEKVEEGKEKEFSVSEVNFGGKRKPVFIQRRTKTKVNNRTQLDAIVDYVDNYCKDNNIEKLPNICLPPLLESIFVPTNSNDYGLDSIPIGIYDNPDAQYQGEAKLNFSENNTMIIGSSATGKTNLVQTIIRQIVNKYSPNEASIYIMDFGSMYLKNFESLNHVGGVVTISDEEKLKNLFKLLMEEIQVRKDKFLELGISSFNAYKEAEYKDFAHLFLFIDNFAAFKEIYADNYEEDFVYLCREGLTYGISIIVTNSQTSGFGYKYMSNFGSRIALHCNDMGEYSSIFDRCRMEPKDVPGRALCKLNKELYELQTYIAFEGEKEIDRSRSIKSFISTINNRYPEETAKHIPEVPKKLLYDFFKNSLRMIKKKFIYPIGIDYSTVDVVNIDFSRVNEFTIIGNDLEKRMSALSAILESVEKNILQEDVKLFIIDNIQRSLKSKKDMIYVENYTIDYSLVGEIISEILVEFERRYDVLLDEGLEALSNEPLYLVIINNKDAIEYISKNKNILADYNQLVQKFKALGVCFIYSDLEDTTVPYSSPEILKRLKENKKGLFTTQSLGEVKFCDVPSGVVRKVKSLGYTDAYLMMESDIKRIKLLEVK